MATLPQHTYGSGIYYGCLQQHRVRANNQGDARLGSPRCDFALWSVQALAWPDPQSPHAPVLCSPALRAVAAPSVRPLPSIAAVMADAATCSVRHARDTYLLPLMARSPLAIGRICFPVAFAADRIKQCRRSAAPATGSLKPLLPAGRPELHVELRWITHI